MGIATKKHKGTKSFLEKVRASCGNSSKVVMIAAIDRGSSGIRLRIARCTNYRFGSRLHHWHRTAAISSGMHCNKSSIAGWLWGLTALSNISTMRLAPALDNAVI
jgi:hypothetical protein